MIISHKYQFIFIKTFKTASSSFEAAFSWISGEEDVLTPDEPVTPAYRTHAWRNWISAGFFNHMHGVDIWAKIEPEIWDNYYKFCIERNPWDKAISWYYWHRQFWERDRTISEFVLNELPLPDWPMYTSNNRVIVDKILRYENLEDELERLYQHLGFRMLLPKVKADARPPNMNYKTLLGEKERKKIAYEFRHIIKLLSYQF